MNTNNDRNPRETINHGHNDWDGSKWIPTYQTWCGICRDAKRNAASTATLDRIYGLNKKADR